MSCEMCTEPDGAPCFPLHGLAPHIHKPDSIEFHTAPIQGFTPDPSDPRQGVHWCPYCGDGKPVETGFIPPPLQDAATIHALGPVYKRIREIVTYDLAEFLSNWKQPITGGPVTMQELLRYQKDWLSSLYVDPRKAQPSDFHKAKLKRHPKRRALRK